MTPDSAKKRRLTHVLQVRLHPLHHAYLATMAHDHDGSMGAYLRALVMIDMVEAAERIHVDGGPDLRERLAEHLEFDGELRDADVFATELAQLHREWISRRDQDLGAAPDDEREGEPTA